MIQRIQTLFLLLSSASLSALWRLPFASGDNPATLFFSDGQYDIKDHPLLLTLAGLGAGIAFLAIFLYNNRPLQLRLGYAIIGLGLALPAAGYLLYQQGAATMAATPGIKVQAGTFLPLAAILFALLANQYIRKDERKVKSMDRLR